MKNRRDDYAALEADTLITAIIYNRTNASKAKFKALGARVVFLRKLILSGK